MSDELKAANEALVESMVRQLRDCVSVGDEMTLDHASLIDDAADWIAGEPARLAAAREEQREACAQFAEYRHGAYGWSEREQLSIRNAIRASPLNSTPLADKIRALRERAEKAEAERDALAGVRKSFADEVAALSSEVHALRAQVERLTSAVPGLAESGPYTMADVERIEAHRGKPYARLRETVEQVERVRAYCEGRIKTHWRVPDVYITANEALDVLEGKRWARYC